MQCIYKIAFLYLFRFDKVIYIQHYYIKVINTYRDIIELIFLFRKTHQIEGSYLSQLLFINSILS